MNITKPIRHHRYSENDLQVIRETADAARAKLSPRPGVIPTAMPMGLVRQQPNDPGKGKAR